MAAKTASPRLVHTALITAQLCFGCGCIIGKFGVSGTNALLFALCREVAAGLVLWILAFVITGHAAPPVADVPRCIAVGFCMYANQMCFTMGIKLADPVSAAAWQPSIPIFTTCLAVLAGYEHASWNKAVGLSLAVGGALLMVLCGGGQQISRGPNRIYGQALFLVNCLSTAGYFILSKELLQKLPAAAITGWSYIVASACMLSTFFIANRYPSLMNIICKDPNGDISPACVNGEIPSSMLLPLLYWIIFSSLLAYFLLTWANKLAKASVVSSYTVLQPIAAGLLATLLVLGMGRDWAQQYGLRHFEVQDLGAIPIVLGLVVLFREPTLEAALPGTGPYDKMSETQEAPEPLSPVCLGHDALHSHTSCQESSARSRAVHAEVQSDASEG